jgi:hypothetical protein
MSWTPCPLCYSPLVGYEGSPCTNPACINGAQNREREPQKFLAPLSGQVTQRLDDVARARKKRQRRAQRAARRTNRRAA